MKILRPVDVNKRLPEMEVGKKWSTVVLVKTRRNLFRYCRYTEGGWIKITHFEWYKSPIIEWYEEIELESLWPDDETVYQAGENATNKQYVKTMFFQEGASFFKNYILKMLKK